MLTSFPSIAGAGPVTGAIQQRLLGWLPVFLWIVIGGIFFGAVTDFGALYASVKNEGKSMGLLIEKYIGKTGRKLFLLFCWLFTLIVTAAFADMVAGTFDAYVTVDGVRQLAPAAQANGAAGTISLLFIAFAMVFGPDSEKVSFQRLERGGSRTGLYGGGSGNRHVPSADSRKRYMGLFDICLYFVAAVVPMWILMQPRDYMTTFMFVGMIIGAVVGLVVARPSMNLPAFTGFHNEGLGGFVSDSLRDCACGAVSGFHSLVSSGTSSKTVSNEKGHAESGVRRYGSGKPSGSDRPVRGRGSRCCGRHSSGGERRSRSFPRAWPAC